MVATGKHVFVLMGGALFGQSTWPRLLVGSLLGFNAHLEGQYPIYFWTDYIAEFPPERVSQEMPSATLDTHTVNNAQHTTEIRATSGIENEHEDQLRLAAGGVAGVREGSGGSCG